MASKIYREWQLKRENGIKYRVVIKNYFDEMDFASCMRTVKSSQFKISESLFRIMLKPDIYSSSQKYVGVFLENLNDWKVQCTWSVRAGSQSGKDDSRYIRAMSKSGYPQFLTFRRIDKGGILNDDGDLIMEVDVKLLGEEVLPSRRDEHGGPTLSMMQDQLDKVKEELDDIKTWTQNMFHEVSARLPSARDVAVLMDQFRYHSLRRLPEPPNTG